MDYKDAIKIAQSVPLSEKVEKAISCLKEYEQMALEANPGGYYLAFSGGKDSVVLKKLAQMAGVKYVPYYNQTTIDPPELVRFIQEKHAEVLWNRPKINLVFYPAIHPKGPPTRRNRWCCEVYKEQGGTGWFKLIGVRAAESPNRAKTWQTLVVNRNGGNTVCPILYWTDEDIWNFIWAYEVEYCSLYDETKEDGTKLFTRLGCVACPMSGRKGRLRDFKRWPRFESLWKLGIKAYFERWKNVPRRDGKERWLKRFSTWEELWDWWVEDPEAQETGEECQTTMLMSGGEPEDEVDYLA